MFQFLTFMPQLCKRNITKADITHRTSHVNKTKQRDNGTNRCYEPNGANRTLYHAKQNKTKQNKPKKQNKKNPTFLLISALSLISYYLLPLCLLPFVLELSGMLLSY